MSQLVDAQGRALTKGEATDVCPQCGSKPKHHKTEEMFGGYWKRLCTQCGYEFAKGKGPIPEIEEDE